MIRADQTFGGGIEKTGSRGRGVVVVRDREREIL